MSIKECRICLESIETPTNQLFSPCLCKGTNAFIHKDCLFQIRQMNDICSLKCQTCNYVYKYDSRCFLENYMTEDEMLHLATIIIIVIVFFVVITFLQRRLKPLEIFLAILQTQFLMDRIVCLYSLDHYYVQTPYEMLYSFIKKQIPPPNIKNI